MMIAVWLLTGFAIGAGLMFAMHCIFGDRGAPEFIGIIRADGRPYSIHWSKCRCDDGEYTNCVTAEDQTGNTVVIGTGLVLLDAMEDLLQSMGYGDMNKYWRKQLLRRLGDDSLNSGRYN
jgi:hypothetical protein